MIKSRPKVQKRGRSTIPRDQGESLGNGEDRKYRRNRCSPIVCMNVNGSSIFPSLPRLFSRFFPSLFPACRFPLSPPLPFPIAFTQHIFGNIFPVVLTLFLRAAFTEFSNGKFKKSKPLLLFQYFDIFQIVRKTEKKKRTNEILFLEIISREVFFRALKITKK